MSVDRIRICLYWGGKIVHDKHVGIYYDPPFAKKGFTVRSRIGFAAFIEKVYDLMHLDKSQIRLKLTLRNPMLTSGAYCTYSGYPIEDDDGVDLIFELAQKHSTYQAEIYIEHQDISLPSQVYMQPDINMTGSISELFTQQNGSQLPQSDPETTFAEGLISRYIVVKKLCPVGPKTSASLPCAQSDHGDYLSTQNVERGCGSQSLSQSILAGEEGATSVDGDTDADVDINDDILVNDEHTHDIPRNTSPRPTLEVPTSMLPVTNSFTDPGDVTNGGHVEHMNVCSENNTELNCGMLFDCKNQVINACKLWHIKHNREFVVHESRINTWYAKCKLEHSVIPCNWHIRAILKKRLRMWKITRWVDGHSCLRTTNRNVHRHLNSEIVANKIIHLVSKDSPCVSIKQIQAHIKEIFSIDISYKKAWYGRRKAVERVYGKCPTSVAELPKHKTRHSTAEHDDNETDECHLDVADDNDDGNDTDGDDARDDNEEEADGVKLRRSMNFKKPHCSSTKNQK